MDYLTERKIGRGEFLRLALLLTGSAALGWAIPGSGLRAAEKGPQREGGKTSGTDSIRIYSADRKEYVMVEKVVKTDREWKEQLTPEQFRVTRKKGTERAYSGKYWDNHEKGIYKCVCCGTDLFRSETKFESGTGWPSFYEPIAPENVRTEADHSWFTTRTEVLCRRCDAHLGHVFDDGPKPTGLRYCMNSVALRLLRQSDSAGAME